MAQLYASKELVRKANVEKTSKKCAFVFELCNAGRLQNQTFLLKLLGCSEKLCNHISRRRRKINSSLEGEANLTRLGNKQ
jgi:hypothetical protein